MNSEIERSFQVSISRRQLIKRSLALGLAAPLIGSLLTACGEDDSDAPASESEDDDATAVEEPSDDEEPDDGEADAEEMSDEESDDGDDGATAETPMSGGGEWIVAVPDEPNSLSPLEEVVVTAAETIQYHIYNGLVDRIGDALELEPRLAEQWESVSPTEWRFSLREDVTFHNGDPFTAHDVKATVDYLLANETSYGVHLGGTGSVEVVDDFTVVFTTEEPFPGLLSVLPRVAIVPQGLFEGTGSFEGVDVSDFAESPVGTGPYQAVEWERGQRVTLQAFENYWGGQPTPDQLVFRFINDATTRVSELNAGGVDIVTQLSVVQAQELDESENTEVMTVDSARIIAYPLNTTQEPLSDVRVRQAINHAIDRESIVESLLEGYGGVVSQPFVEGWLGYDPSIEPYPYDPDRARELLEEAGFSDGVSIDWNYSTGVFLADEAIAQAVANMVGEVGINVNLIPTERARIQEDLLNGAFNGITAGAYGTAYEPVLLTNWFFVRPDGIYSDELRGQIMEYLEAGMEEVDLEAREQIYQDFAQFAHDEALWMYVHYQVEIVGKQAANPWQVRPWRSSKAQFAFFEMS